MPGATLRRTLIFVHRWLGVALCLVFLLWFVSGIVMMYWSYPTIAPWDRIAHLPSLDMTRVRLSVPQAFERLSDKRLPDQIFLTTYDGRSAYRFRMGRRQEFVFADDGTLAAPSEALALRVASQWVGFQQHAARVDTITAEDQWTVSGTFRALRPLYKFTWANGDEVYVSQKNGEVVQHTTSASRFWAYFGAIPHWLYFTPLRKDGALWNRVVVWASGIATFSAFIGLIIGVWMYSPSKAYLHKGSLSRIPYRGQKRLHTILGLFFGLLACTWAFSGLLSMDPFPMGGAASSKNARQIQTALHTKVTPEAFSKVQLSDLAAREIEFASFAGQPVLILTTAPRKTQIVTVDGAGREQFDHARIFDIVRAAVKPIEVAETRVVTTYEAFYLNRQKLLPLPALFVQLNDSGRSMFYIDPKTANVLAAYDEGLRWNRWLYHGLHSLDLPWLYSNRPAWDIVVLVLLGGGVWLSITSIILAFEVLSGKMRGNRQSQN